MAVLTRNSVAKTLVTMAVPMLAGTFSMNAYNLADTWFVSQLGTIPLAAMGFTFPIVMLFHCCMRGISSGVTTLASFELGKQDHDKAARFVTYGILFTLICILSLVAVNWIFADEIFSLLGASKDVLPLVKEYMLYWFPGAVFMILPASANGILMSVGSSKSASGIMVLGTLINLVLDPIMIFGYLGCPAMGIRGAALATSISHLIIALCVLYLLGCKYKLLASPRAKMKEYWNIFKRITLFAGPGIASMIMGPVSAMVVTKIISKYGVEAIAAAGAAGRIEMFAFMIPMTLGMSLTPFVSQNFGAGRIDRVRDAQKISITFSLLYGALTTLLFFVFAPHVAAFFTDDPKMADVLISYLRIVSFGYGMLEAHRYCTFFFNGMHKPVSSACLNLFRTIVLLLPLTYFGGCLWNIEGVFFGRLAADVTAGACAILWLNIKQHKNRS